jgi:acyl-CoA reductase-like NAD-dependent aldehyde dehydrogenase
MTGSNLPPGVTDRMIDEAAGAFDEPNDPPTREEEEGDAWEYWHNRAIAAEVTERASKSISDARKETIDRLVAAIDEAANLVWSSPTQAEQILRRAAAPYR